jgi:hypothetical protein
MYKVPLHVLEGFLKSLEISNAVLKEAAERDDSPYIQVAIKENEKQINIIKLNFGFNG